MLECNTRNIRRNQSGVFIYDPHRDNTIPEAEETLIAVDSFSEVDFPVEVIDAYTVTAEELAPLNPDVVILAFDFNGIVEGLENQEINYVLLPPAKNFEDVYSQIETIGSHC